MIIDKENMHLFPEEVQRVLQQRLATAFSPERPYTDKIVEAMKDKFKQWERYKVNQQVEHLNKINNRVRKR